MDYRQTTHSMCALIWVDAYELHWEGVVPPDGNDCCWYKISSIYGKFWRSCIVSHLFSLDLLIALNRNKTNISWTMHPTLDNFVFYFWYWDVFTQRDRRLILTTKWVFATSKFWWIDGNENDIWWGFTISWNDSSSVAPSPLFLTLSRRPYSYSNNLIRFHWMLFSTECRHRRQGVCYVRRSIVGRVLYSVNHSSAFRTRHFCFCLFRSCVCFMWVSLSDSRTRISRVRFPFPRFAHWLNMW